MSGTWRSGRAAKAALLAIEIAGALLALAAGLAVLLFWRLQSGPVSLELFTASAEFAIERALPPGHRARIDRATLSRRPQDGAIEIALDAIRVEGPGGARVAELSSLTLDFSVADLADGKLGPRTIRIVDPTLRIIRGADRRFSLDYAEARAGPPRGNAFELLTGGPFFRGAFQEAELIGARVHFYDSLSGRAWRADAAEARITRYRNGYAARLSGVFDVGGRPASLRLDATYLETTGLITADVAVEDAPLGDVIAMFYGDRAALYEGPVSGAASIMLTRSGEVISSRIEGRAEGGVIRLGDAARPVGHIDLVANFDPGKNRFDLERFQFDIAGASGAVRGALVLALAADTLAPARVSGEFTADAVTLDLADALPEKVRIEDATARLDYDIDARRLDLSALTLEANGVRIEGALGLDGAHDDRAPGVVADLKVAGPLGPSEILSLWPHGLGEGARDFVETRLPRARVSNIVFAMRLPPGAKAAGSPMPDGALRLTFDIADATAIYAETMTPVTGGSGRATLTGNRFLIESMKGRVGAVALSEGSIDFTALSPRGAPVYYRFTADGSPRAILGVLDQPPLRVLDETGLEADRFTQGSARARVEIMRPNRRDVEREAYQYRASARFENAAISEFYRGNDLVGGAGALEVSGATMTLSARADFGGAPVDLSWRRSGSGRRVESVFRLAGVVDSTTGDVFGVPTRQFLRGPAAFEAEARGAPGALESLVLRADLSRAAVTLDAIGWEKPENASAQGEIAMIFSDGGVDIRRLTISGDGVDVEGAAKFDASGLLLAADFERLRFEGGADLRLQLARSAGGGLEATATGAFLNAGAALRDFIEAGPPPPREGARRGSGMQIRARIDALELREGVRYRDASLDFLRDAAAIQTLALSARTESGAPLSVTLRQTGAHSGPAQAVEARTDDIGRLLAGVFGVGSIRGGEGSMEVLVTRGEGAPRGISGAIAARNMRVVGAPLLARIFAAGSLTGLVDLLNGDGISLNQASARFDFADGVFRLSDARASGPSVGITVQGSIATGPGAPVDLNGAVAPAYAVNSFLGGAPLIGELFVNRAGEGIVALSYDVRGRSDAPLVSVNPLSALTPGVLRRIFEPVERPAQPGAAQTGRAPPAPVAAPEGDPEPEPEP